MCQRIFVDGKACHTIRELSRAIGADNVVISGDYDPPVSTDSNICCCPVMAKETAERADRKTFSDSMDTFFLADGDEYLWACDDCGAEVLVQDQSEHSHGGSSSFSGITFRRGGVSVECD